MDRPDSKVGHPRALSDGVVLVGRQSGSPSAIRQALDGAPLEPLQRPRWVDRAKQLMSLV